MFWNKHVEIKPLEIKLSGEINELLSLFRIGLVSYLTNQEVDLKRLKLELMRPLLEAEWKKTNAEEAEKINRALISKGEKIRKAWERYKDELLTLQREGKNTDLVKAKLEILDVLMEA